VRILVYALILVMACAGCGGGQRSTTLNLAAIPQPTPDPTLDAVVRDLPRALAGVTPTPTPTAVVVAVPRPAVKVPIATPTTAPKSQPRPAVPTSTSTKPRH
jgi:hypothetical protein